MTTRGAKRAATSDPAAPDLPSKRVMDGPCFDVHRAESSHQSVMAGPATLDPGRAEAASKHVRALNTQFARWVQLQMQNHPLEIWEDGLKDYISHASEIMDKFKDVVNWLRQKKAGSMGVSSPGPLKDDEKTTLPAADDSKSSMKTSSDSGQKVPITSPTSSVSQSPNSQNIFSFSSQQKPPAFSGNQSAAEASVDADEGSVALLTDKCMAQDTLSASEKPAYDATPGFFVEIQAQSNVNGQMKIGLIFTGVILICRTNFLYIIVSRVCISELHDFYQIKVTCLDGTRILVPRADIRSCGEFIVFSCFPEKKIDTEIVMSVTFEDGQLKGDELVYTVTLKDYDDHALMTSGVVGKVREMYFLHNCRASTHTESGSPVFNKKGRIVGFCFERLCGILVASTVKALTIDLSRIYQTADTGIHELLQHVLNSDMASRASISSGEAEGDQAFPSNWTNEDMCSTSLPDLAPALASSQQADEDNNEQNKRMKTTHASSQQAQEEIGKELEDKKTEFGPKVLEACEEYLPDGPSFAIHGTESSHQNVMAGPVTLDPGRADAAS